MLIKAQNKQLIEFKLKQKDELFKPDEEKIRDYQGITKGRVQKQNKKSRIRETKHLSTYVDSSTDAIGGWTKAKSAKKTFICAAILDHFETKMFKC